MDADRAFLVDRAARVFREEGVECFGWAVLINHYHMLARFSEPPKRPMQRLNTALAMRVRRLNGGQGAVFQDRYFGVPCADESALLTRLAYVTANPIHHRIVPSVSALEDYAWTSFGEVTGRRPAKLANPSAALALLAAPHGRGVASLVDLLEMRVRIWNREDENRMVARHPDVDAPLDGDADEGRAAPDAASNVAATRWERIAARRDRLRAGGWTPADLIGPASEVVGCDPDAVRRVGRSHAACRARAIVAHLACDHVGWPTGEVATALAVSASAVVQARARAPALLLAAGADLSDVLRRAGVPD